jgi:hypothetical protein
MSDVAVVCPHCGDAHPDRDERMPVVRREPPPEPVAARKKIAPGTVTREEAAALLAASGVPSRPPAFWKDFFLPHPRLGGALVLVDLALIVLTLPLVAGIVVTLASGKSRKRIATVSGTYVANMGIALLGGVVLLVVGWSVDRLDVVWPLVLVGTLALLARVALTSWARRHEAAA